MKVKIINCLFAFSFFLVVAGRNIPSTPLSPDVNFDDPPLHHILPPPPPSPLVNGGDVVPQTPSLSKPPPPIINYGNVVPQSPPVSKPQPHVINCFLETMAWVLFGIFAAISVISICCAIYLRIEL